MLERVYLNPRFRAGLDAEAADGPWWVLADFGPRYEAGRSAQSVPAPGIVQQMWAQEIATRLQKELHHDGFWIVVFVDPMEPSIFVAQDGHSTVFRAVRLIWLDADGDFQFTVEINERFGRIMSEPTDSWLQQCEQSWQQWKVLHNEVLDPQAAETIKFNQGQDRAKRPGRRFARA